ncbi:MAG: 50S ribosomal protein L3 [Deltaproteobacteria bacterium]|nr:50S ribosomal protein L3 [Deltaproteobacteria bacterium]
MGKGILGRKVGMTALFDEFGQKVSVTVVEAGPCVVVRKKDPAKDKYNAVQLGFVEQRADRLRKPDAGQYRKAGVPPKRFLREIRLSAEEAAGFSVGQVIGAEDVFKVGDKLDITGVSIGKGFQGVVKRYHFKGNTMTRGTHEYRRHPGSIGMREWPGKIFKGKKLPGHMGGERVTVQNLVIFRLDSKRNLLFVKGAVPGSAGNLLVIRRAVKSAAGVKGKAK